MNIPLLERLTKEPGAPGFEQKIRNLVIEEVGSLVDEVYTDAMGSVHAVKKGAKDKTVVVAAHIDEIGFIVSHIDDDGFIRFQCLGGFDPKTLTAQRVWIHGKEDVLGVMGTKPIHIMDPEEKSKMPKNKDYYIDTGLNVEELKKLVAIGDPITRERGLVEMGEMVNSKSLDNRVCVFLLIETLRNLKSKSLPYNFHAIFTVQEEVGLRGATTAASGVDNDFVINLDVTLANDVPGASPHEYVTKLGNGAAIKVLDGSTICDYRMVKFMKEVAKKNDIKTQLELLPRGGTDTAALQRYSKGGSIAGAISVPTRYLHQVIEMAHKSDIQNCIDLLENCVLDIDKYNWDFK